MFNTLLVQRCKVGQLVGLGAHALMGAMKNKFYGDWILWRFGHFWAAPEGGFVRRSVQ